MRDKLFIGILLFAVAILVVGCAVQFRKIQALLSVSPPGEKEVETWDTTCGYLQTITESAAYVVGSGTVYYLRGEDGILHRVRVETGTPTYLDFDLEPGALICVAVSRFVGEDLEVLIYVK